MRTGCRATPPTWSTRRATTARCCRTSLDLLLLGLGEDGHTASLFPGSPALAERSARVVVVTGPKPPNPRLSITPPVIEAARAILVLVSGAGKAKALARALEGPPDVTAVPAQLARRGAWIVDREAAAGCSRAERPVPR